MLKFLKISNFAVIETLQIDFHEGLNLLTGETGSGKSIIVDALGLLLGGRSSTTQIRTGEKTAIIEGLWGLAGKSSLGVQHLLSETNVGEIENYQLLIRRELSLHGKNRIYVNNKIVPNSILRTLQRFLVEIHGQGEQRALLSAQSHLELLDQFAGCSMGRRQVAAAYSKWRATRKALAHLEHETEESERASDLLQYQLSEIETLAPKLNEDEELQAERKLLTHVETALQIASGAYYELYESESSILSQLASLRKKLDELVKIDKRLELAVGVLEGNSASLADIADSLRDYGATMDFSSTRLAEIENRLDELERLKRKYKTSLEGLLNISNELSARLAAFNEIAQKEPALRAAMQEAEANYLRLARKLSKCRGAAKDKFEKRVMNDLKHVALENAQFIIEIATTGLDGSDNNKEDLPSLEDDGNAPGYFYSSSGIDQVEFLLSANPGESPRSLAHVASGGELSRLMLTLRTIGVGQQEQKEAGTLIFDEIDAGIGGRVAEAVGRRLKALALTQQVLCVTHQSQIARFANHHYLIEKLVKKGRTRTIARELSVDERVGELARMIGGDEQASTARETARWLLEDSET